MPRGITGRLEINVVIVGVFGGEAASEVRGTGMGREEGRVREGSGERRKERLDREQGGSRERGENGGTARQGERGERERGMDRQQERRGEEAKRGIADYNGRKRGMES